MSDLVTARTPLQVRPQRRNQMLKAAGPVQTVAQRPLISQQQHAQRQHMEVRLTWGYAPITWAYNAAIYMHIIYVYI